MGKPLIIYGAGGLGREVRSMLPFLKQSYDLVGFLDDGVTSGSEVDQIRVLGGIDWLKENTDPVGLVIAIGNPRVKANVFGQLRQFNQLHFPALIHSHAMLQDVDRIQVGEGSIICANVVLTTAVKIGKHVLLNLNTTVGRATNMSDFTSVMAGVKLAGNVNLGSQVMVGSGSNIINNIKVGDSSIIGAGSVVNHDIPAAATAAGVPARVIR